MTDFRWIATSSPVVPAVTRFILFIALLLAVPALAREFDFRTDTFAFSNDTVMRYGLDEQGRLHISRRDKPVEYSHRCFVLARAVLQFHQFARFDPQSPKLSREEYQRRILGLCRVPVWARGPREKISFPGFANLHEFSIAYEGLLKEHLGNWVPSYFRVGNWRMAMGHPRCGQAAAGRWLVKSIEEGKPRAVYLARFPHMNHVVVPYAMKRLPDGTVKFDVYDPNYPGEPSWLLYREDQRSFEFEKRWYFPGGRVNLMRIFISPLH